MENYVWNSQIMPKKKSTIQVFRVNNVLYIGSSGSVAEIPDPTGCIDYLFDRMNGRRTVAELHEMVRRAYPEVTSQELATAVAQFDEAGFLENGTSSPIGLLDEYDLTRWERNIDFLGAFTTMRVNKYELQYRLKTAKVAVLGLGGLGTHLLYDLAAAGCQDIRAVEFDRLELSNLNRQILYDEADLGRPKAELAAERMRGFSPRLHLDIVPMRLSSTADVLGVIHDREYVFCVADRPEMEIVRWVNEACVRYRVTLISGGLDSRRGVYWSMIPGTTGCVECWHRQVQLRDPVAATLLVEQAQPQRPQYGGDNTSFVSLVSLLAGLMLSDFVRMATNIAAPVSPGRLIEVQFSSMDMGEAERWSRLMDCPICQNVSTSALSLPRQEIFVSA